MNPFNLIQDNLGNCKRCDNYYIIGLKGNLQEMYDKKKNWDAGDNTKASVLIYNSDTDSIAWKNVKVSSKGYYINLSGRIYLESFK